MINPITIIAGIVVIIIIIVVIFWCGYKTGWRHHEEWLEEMR